jgi:hypothetical protein
MHATPSASSSSGMVNYLSYGSNMSETRFRRYLDTFRSKSGETVERIGAVQVAGYGAYFAEDLGTYWSEPWSTAGVFISKANDRTLRCVAYRMPEAAFEQLVSAECYANGAESIDYKRLGSEGELTLSQFPYGRLIAVPLNTGGNNEGDFAITCTAPWEFGEVLSSHQAITPELLASTQYRVTNGNRLVPHLKAPNPHYAKHLVAGLMSAGLTEEDALAEILGWPGADLLGMPNGKGESTFDRETFVDQVKTLDIASCIPSSAAFIAER